MGEMNQYLVLEYVRDHPKTTRTDIASELGLSMASVSRIVTALLAEGRLVEVGNEAAEGLGRPRVGLEINLGLDAVLGIDLGGTKCHGALADISGRILTEAVVTVEAAGGALPALDRVWQMLAADAAERGLTVASAAVGVPAVVDQNTGVAWRGPNVGWDGVQVGAHLAQYQVPVLIDNDVKLAAIAEGATGKAAGVSDYVLLSIGTGLGGAVVSGGHLVRGRVNAAGEFGVMIPTLEMLQQNRHGQTGGLESILSGAGIKAHVEALRAANADAAAELPEGAGAREVIAGAQERLPHSTALMQQIVDALALAIINVCAVADPEVIVVDGTVGRALAPFFPEAAAIVARHLEDAPRIVPSELGPNSTVRGAIAGAVQRYRSAGAPDLLGTPTEGIGA